MLRAVIVLSLILASFLLVSSEVVFTRSKAPEGWTIGLRADSHATVNFIVALKQQHLDVLESTFWSVSDPKSPEYQNFMSIEEINSIIAPRTEDVTLVTEWLLLHGVKASEIKSLGDALQVSTSVSVAENLFQTQFHQFTHKESKKIVLRQFGAFSVPTAVLWCVDMISGISSFPPPREARHGHRIKSLQSGPKAGADYGVIAQTIYNIYKIPAQTLGNASTTTSTAVAEFEDQYFDKEDLQQYAKITGIPITPLTDDHIVGPEVDQPATEADLDIQFIATVNIEAANWFWIQADPGWVYSFATQFYSTTNVPLVVSISYGWYEGNQCAQGIGAEDCVKAGVVSGDAFVARVNTEFQKIGLRGVSLVISSGDSGAHTRTDETCTAPTLRAEFPAASPYVTSVGATQLTQETQLSPAPSICSALLGSWKYCAASGTEVAVSFDIAGFTSGGGFSEVAAQPSYQTTAVKNYLSSGVVLPPAKMYNASNRAHPDVAAVGHNGLIYEGTPEAVGGTSQSAPTFAAILSLLNQASIAKSGKPLGFVNPLLYQIWADQPSAFTDITVGDNKCTESGCAKSCEGWLAYKGWDPVTGLGTPNYPALLQYIQTH